MSSPRSACAEASADRSRAAARLGSLKSALVAALLLAALAGPGCRRPPPPLPDRGERVVLHPFAGVGKSDRLLAREALEALIGGPVAVERPAILSDDLLIERDILDADRLLDRLIARRRGPRRPIVALVHARLYSRRTTDFFGFGDRVERVAVVSLRPLWQDKGGWRSVGKEKFRERLVKVLFHETAHAFGLGHCRERECLLRQVRGQRELDEQPVRLCPACSAKLAAALGEEDAAAPAAPAARVEAFARSRLAAPEKSPESPEGRGKGER